MIRMFFLAMAAIFLVSSMAYGQEVSREFQQKLQKVSWYQEWYQVQYFEEGCHFAKEWLKSMSREEARNRQGLLHPFAHRWLMSHLEQWDMYHGSQHFPEEIRYKVQCLWHETMKSRAK